jgi:hypothetical protein
MHESLKPRRETMAKGQRAVKTVAATGREKPLKARKPMSGFGMKQSR